MWIQQLLDFLRYLIHDLQNNTENLIKTDSGLWKLVSFPHVSRNAWDSTSAVSKSSTCMSASWTNCRLGGEQIAEQWQILTWTHKHTNKHTHTFTLMSIDKHVGRPLLQWFWTGMLASAERGCWYWCPLRKRMDSTVECVTHHHITYLTSPDNHTKSKSYCQAAAIVYACE